MKLNGVKLKLYIVIYPKIVTLQLCSRNAPRGGVEKMEFRNYHSNGPPKFPSQIHFYSDSNSIFPYSNSGASYTQVEDSCLRQKFIEDT